MSLFVSLEFTENDCKVALADRGKGGRLILKSLSRFDLPKPEKAEEKVAARAQALRDHLKAKKISVKKAVVTIPKNYVMARTATLPSSVDEELAGMARFEAERHIPFNAERHVISHFTLAKRPPQGCDVLMAAVDGPIANEYLDLCTRAGLEVTNITVSGIASFNALVAAEPTALPSRTTLLINVGQNATDLIIATNGQIAFMRGTNMGVNRLFQDLEEQAEMSGIGLADLAKMDALEPQLFFRPPVEEPVVHTYDDPIEAIDNEPNVFDINTGTDTVQFISNSAPPPPPPPDLAVHPQNKGAVAFSAWLNRLIQEVKRTYEFADREFRCPMITNIFLSGEGAAIGKLSGYFQSNFSIDAAVFDPTRASAALPKNLLPAGEASYMYAAAIGAAIGRTPGTVHVNLLPGQYTESRAAKRQQKSYIITGVLALIGLILGYFYVSDQFTTNRLLLEQYVQQNKKDKARVTDLSEMKTRLNIISNNVQDDRGAIDILERLSGLAAIPEKATLTSFEYTRGDSVKLQGDAKDLETANQLVSDLRATGYFLEARLENTQPNKTLRNRPPIPVLGFTAVATFPKPEKKKPAAKPKAKTSGDSADGLE